MLDNAAFVDLRNYIKKRIVKLKYRVGTTSYDVPVSDAMILTNGVVRIQAPIVPGTPVTINRIEAYNTNGELWAHQDTVIDIEPGQTGVLYWFEFITEEKQTKEVKLNV